MDDTELHELLHAADPYPEDAPLDPASVSDVVTRTREVVRMNEEQMHRRWWTGRRALALAAVVAVVAVAAVAGITRLGGDGSTGRAGGVALGAGSATASCLQFTEQALAMAPVAFDGTVTSVEGETVTLSVSRWYRGGTGETVELHAPDLTGSLLEGGVGFEKGERYLVSAYEDAGRLAPSVCGFTVTYSDEMAATFERAFA